MANIAMMFKFLDSTKQQPFQWSAANYLYVSTASNPIDLGNETLLGDLGFLGTTCYWTGTNKYSWQNVSNEISKIPAAQPVVTDIQTSCCADGTTKHLLPVYGLATGGGATLSNWNAVPQITALANLVLAVLGGQAKAPLNQGTVIMTLDSYGASWETDLLKLLPEPYHAR